MDASSSVHSRIVGLDGLNEYFSIKSVFQTWDHGFSSMLNQTIEIDDLIEKLSKSSHSTLNAKYSFFYVDVDAKEKKELLPDTSHVSIAHFCM